MTHADSRFGLLSIAIAVLTLATALIHFVLAIPSGDIMFYANALAYIVLLGALYLPIPALAPYRRLVRYALIGLAAVTVIGWIIIGDRVAIGYIDKVIELVLIVLLVVEARQS